ncbi:MAG: molybdopterin molybdenumtransferase MoeA [Gammaproteobacteria bacterium]|nr:molybdopterin molybdenumtransferase MoeA [Gammaproteobacteria bacterium]
MNSKISFRAAPSCADDSEPSLLTVVQARSRILDSVTPVTERQRLFLRDALDRVLATEIVSPINVPGHTNSAMDGYALSGNDLPESIPREYRVIGTAYAGAPCEGICESGECIRIMTGAPMPAGTDTVVMQEQTKASGDAQVVMLPGQRPGQNVRQAGEDIAAGNRVLEPGRRLTPADLGILSSLGIGEVSVYRRPRVAFFSTGDELRSIGETLNKGDVYDSNRYSLYGMLKRLDLDVFDLGVIPDKPEALRDAFQSAASMADLVITSGGVSVGEADYVKATLDALGQIGFWKISMKPGRPLAYGSLGKALFFGLPGNPVAVMVTFMQFVEPAIRYLASGQRWQPLVIKARATESIRKRPGRYEFQRGILSHSSDGTLLISGTGQQGSGILTSMSRANCFILLDEQNAGVSEGDLIDVQPF